MNPPRQPDSRDRQDRRRTKRCPVDKGELENRGGMLACTTCDWAAGQLDRIPS